MAPPRAPKSSGTVNPEVLQAYLIGVKEDVVEIRGTLDKLVEAIAGIGRVEARQMTFITEMEAANTKSSNLEVRVAKIETILPGLVELRRWVVGGMVAGLGMMLVAVASLVLYPRQYVVLDATSKPAAIHAPEAQHLSPVNPFGPK